MRSIKGYFPGRNRGFLDGQFLIAMPGMTDERFARTVIFVCAHSDDGAMGFILNRSRQIRFSELVARLGLDDAENRSRSSQPDAARGSVPDFPILTGGPVEPGRGFVLHSDDYLGEATLPVNNDLCLTATMDILRAIRDGQGPRRKTLMLGYAGWSSGQLEIEMAANTWLNCPADDELVFDLDLGAKYDRVLSLMGIPPAMLSAQCGHA